MESFVRPHLEAGNLSQARKVIAQHLSTYCKASAAQNADAAYWSCQANDFKTASQLYQLACDMQPQHPTYHYNLATTLRVMGDTDGALHALNRHLELVPHDAEAHWLATQLFVQTPDTNRVDELKALLNQNLPAKQAVHAWYALGKTYEDLGEYDCGFNAIASGANLRRRYLKYQVSHDRTIFTSIEQRFSLPWQQRTMSQPQGQGNLFIVGMPRSGTTLVERLLGAHDGVAMGGEMNTFSSCMMTQVNRMGNAPGILEAIDLSSRCDFSSLGKAYRKATCEYQASQAFLTDKLPLNFLYLGLIHKALPEARIIWVERQPMDTIWAVYKHLFTHTYPFSYDLEEITEYYLGYRKLMAHWQRLLGDNLYNLKYENLLDSPTAQTQQLARFCGLSLQERCLDFHQSQQPVTTGSATQVRQPIYRSSIGKWKNVAKQLDAVKQKLQKAGLRIE